VNALVVTPMEDMEEHLNQNVTRNVKRLQAQCVEVLGETLFSNCNL
jgi:hypothetical protein